MINKDFPEIDHWFEHRVSYGETDAMGVVYHAEYIHIFERSRGSFSREKGLSYSKMEGLGLMLPVVEVHCEYKHPARYDDLLYVRVGISEWKRASLRFSYELYDETKTKLLTIANTFHACTNKEGRPIRIPEWVVETLQKK